MGKKGMNNLHRIHNTIHLILHPRIRHHRIW
uniref:Uncharacterized protein n=1 Tax=Rhizophora mucronata TaxID=61149 RepID=A0A2P2QPE1_RHIMU